MRIRLPPRSRRDVQVHRAPGAAVRPGPRGLDGSAIWPTALRPAYLGVGRPISRYLRSPAPGRVRPSPDAAPVLAGGGLGRRLTPAPSADRRDRRSTRRTTRSRVTAHL